MIIASPYAKLHRIYGVIVEINFLQPILELIIVSCWLYVM